MAQMRSKKVGEIDSRGALKIPLAFKVIKSDEKKVSDTFCRAAMVSCLLNGEKPSL